MSTTCRRRNYGTCVVVTVAAKGRGGGEREKTACLLTAARLIIQCVTESSLFGLYGLWPRDLIRPPILGLLLDHGGSNHTKIAALATANQKSNM